MTGFIKKESIDEVTQRADIVRIVGEYVPLVQKGKDWWGCCPFHHEKSASFHVEPDKKFYYCFGCHASGTVFNFLMEMEHMSFAEAVETVAKKEGIQLEYSNGGEVYAKKDPKADLKAEYINLYERVSTSFHYILTQTESGKFALDYIKKRGLTDETIKKFRLGYSPLDGKWLRNFLLKNNYTASFLDESGLFSRKNPEYAFFRDRLMFPIFNKAGEAVAMGGRFLRGDPDKNPKYLNSGDLIQYKKGDTLYAYNFAKQAVRENKKIILCEGYMDCIAYHQCGLTFAVAPLGTALTEEQIALFKPFVNEVLLSFDSDNAGQKATIRAILMCRKHDLTVKVIVLKGGKDPAEIMINYGADVLTGEVNNAILDDEFLLSRLEELYPKNTPEGKSKALSEFFPYIDSLKSEVQKNACLEQFCAVYDTSFEAAKKDYINRSSIPLRSQSTQNEPEKAKSSGKIRQTAELGAVLSVISDNSERFSKLRNDISVDDLNDQWARQLYIILEECMRSGSFSVSSVLNRLEGDGLDGLKELVIKAVDSPFISDAAVEDGIKLLKRHNLEKQCSNLLLEIKRLEGSALPEDKEKLLELVSRKADINRRLESLKKGIDNGSNN
ncbi:MAG: DNA primase [Treponema sp.]|nr:DNA primase [Treponema sp.]